jgi:ATP-binding cassette, subfamily C (CFTR/MRP), member 1
MSLGHLVKCRVAVTRIGRFLNEPEKDSTLEDEEITSSANEDLISLKGSFSWPRAGSSAPARPESESVGLLDAGSASVGEETACLTDIDFKIKPGSLCAVVGPVGSGKTSFLHALLGEMTPLDGAMRNLPGKISYVAQEAVILNGSVRQNILFDWDDDMPFQINEARYREAISVSSLEEDLKQLENGEKTKIGDRGVNLSGGQKQRVALARAYYADADVYLFDDPLSAVDVNVGKYLYDELITNRLRDKTRILVTHQTQYLASADVILFVENGRIIESDSAFVRLMKQDNEKNKEEDDTIEDGESEKKEEKKKVDSHAVPLDDEDEDEESPDSNAESSFNLKNFLTFHRFAGSWAWVALMWGLFILSELSGGALLIAATLMSIADPEKGEVAFYLKLYIYICVQVSVVSFFRNLAQSHVFLRIASNMHQTLLDAIIRTRTSFFDSTPQGRIMSRFSNDQLQMDSSMLWSSREFWSAIAMVVDLSIIMVVFAPLTVVLVVALFGCYYLANRFYVRAITALSRLKSISLGDIFSHVTESLEAVVTIRAYGVSNRFEQHNIWLNNRDARTCAAYEYVMSWYGAIVRLISSIFVFFVLLVASWESGSSAYVGLIIMCSMSISSSVGWIFETLGMQQGLYVNLNRIVEFTELPAEVDAAEARKRVSLEFNWPQKGEIEFSAVNLAYEQYASGAFSQSSRLALRDVSFKITGGERIGIVGRTGAGKSSLLAALFRMAEISSGSIKIDGVDIHRLGLQQVRRALAIVPQHPAMFQGSLRENIDPFSQHEDKTIWDCLGRVQLAKFVGSLPEGLSSSVVEGGSNLSVGQRQLICLARALLMKRRSPNLILVLDECTASVDYATDAVIQQVAREEFEGSTVIVIAHRLDTVMHSDRILVMDAGSPAEFDTPANLVAQGGIFAQIVSKFKTQMKQ